MDAPTPLTAAALIDAKGGPAAFAASTGLGHGAVRMMKVRNKLPRGSWPEIMVAFPDVTLDVLRATELRSTDLLGDELDCDTRTAAENVL